jgi:hypothetical protein
MHINRRAFARNLGAAAFGGSRLAAAQTANPSDAFYAEIVRANDDAVAQTSQELNGSNAQRPMMMRRVSGQAAVLAASFCCPESAHYKSEQLIAPLEKAANILLAAQHPDGTVDSGNLNSPPDTGFVLEPLCTALSALRKMNDQRLRTVQDTMGRFIVAAGEALVTGGVHTPNHRWVISSALARINSLFPAKKYVDRIDDWLGEGIYQDEDGQFPERSTGIYSRVENGAFTTMARLLSRPQLLDPVRKNLDMVIYYIHPDGEIETVGSRRQDYNLTSFAATYYLEFRYLAARDKNGLYAAMARMIESKQGDKVKRTNPLIEFLEEPLLRAPLPESKPIPVSYARVFSNSGLARIRRDDVSATVFGGSDWPMGVASGLSSNPTFFSYRKGKAVLESVRMGGQFFSEGAFRSEGLQASGNRYSLHQRFDVPYYQPLPRSERNARGDYPLTPARDSRFWSKLNFPRRQMGNVQTLDQKLTIVENGGAFELQFDISGHEGVPFLVELAFRPGGKFEGDIVEQAKDRTYFFKSGMARYRVGDDVIEFGPGISEHQYLNLSGPSYAAHGAALRANGHCVYLTGFTPFRRTLTVRVAT